MAAPLDKSVVCPILVGRSNFLSSLDHLIERALTRQGQIALLSGEAGIGKSRLVAEARARASARGLAVLQGNCFENDSALPYAPLLDLVRVFCSTRPSDEIARFLGPATGILSRVLPELGQLLPDLTPTTALEPAQEKHRLFESFAQLLLRFGAHHPTLVIIEDLHWSDSTTFEFLSRLTPRIASQPLLLMLTFRSDESNPRLAHFLAQMDRGRTATELTLNRLSIHEVEAMLRAIFDLNRPIRVEF